MRRLKFWRTDQNSPTNWNRKYVIYIILETQPTGAHICLKACPTVFNGALQPRTSYSSKQQGRAALSARFTHFWRKGLLCLLGTALRGTNPAVETSHLVGDEIVKTSPDNRCFCAAIETLTAPPQKFGNSGKHLVIFWLAILDIRTAKRSCMVLVKDMVSDQNPVKAFPRLKPENFQKLVGNMIHHNR